MAVYTCNVGTLVRQRQEIASLGYGELDTPMSQNYNPNNYKHNNNNNKTNQETVHRLKQAECQQQCLGTQHMASLLEYSLLCVQTGGAEGMTPGLC